MSDFIKLKKALERRERVVLRRGKNGSIKFYTTHKPDTTELVLAQVSEDKDVVVVTRLN